MILVVEDVADDRELLCAVLAAEGYAVSAAANGLQALQQLHEGLRPRVIISDLQMPEMDGAALCRALAEDPALAGLKVVLLSGESRLSQVAASVGAHYLPKPADPRQLLQLVR